MQHSPADTASLPAWDKRVLLTLDYEEALLNYEVIARQYLTPASLPDAQQEERQMAWMVRRYLCRNDLFYLLAFACKRHDMFKRWLYERCREVQADPDNHLDLWAREHYKSTIITFGKTIQDILCNPEVTFGIFSFSQEIAEQFLRQIKQEFELNQTLKHLFPDILWNNPKTNAPLWTNSAITVKRVTNPKEATIEAWGIIDAQPVSKHYSHRVYDDLVHERSVNTPEMIAKTTYKWELSDSLAKSDGESGGIERYVGTIYHAHDTYSVMLARKVVKPRIKPCTSDGSTDFSKAVLLPQAVLEKKYRKQGAYTFGCQMLLNPKIDSVSGFSLEHVKYWDGKGIEKLSVIMIVDPASRQGSSNDYTSIWVLGLGGDGIWRVIDFHRDRLSLAGRTERIFAFHRKYKPLYVFYEQYGASSDIEHMQHVMAQEVYDFSSTIVTLPCQLSEDPRTKSKFKHIIKSSRLSKSNRIQRLSPVFERGDILLKRSIIRQNYRGEAEDFIKSFLEQEFSVYPVVSHDDGLDSLSYICDPVVRTLTPRPVEPEKLDNSELMIRRFKDKKYRVVV